MNTEVSLFQLSDDKSIIFRYNQFSGMVGETYYSQSFDVINNETLEVVGSKISKRRRTAERSYNLLKEFYKRVEGKARRIEFHSHMKNFSQENIERQDENSLADAISRVI